MPCVYVSVYVSIYVCECGQVSASNMVWGAIMSLYMFLIAPLLSHRGLKDTAWNYEAVFVHCFSLQDYAAGQALCHGTRAVVAEDHPCREGQ